jgi:leader peptidase (prepilin peptidase)/N-methyltransferase
MPAISGSMIVAILWLFALGAAIGSFLNVVVYRLPAGISIVNPGSHCPLCKHPIRWYDNLPVLGWLLLGGRCRDCRARIAVRYPLVEAATGGLFVILGIAECLSRGAHLPPRWQIRDFDAVLTSLTLGKACGLYAFHLVLMCTLLSAALIEYDGHRLPRRLAGVALAVGALAPLAWPHLHPVPALGPAGGWATGGIDSALGIAAGTIVGLLTRPCVRATEKTGATLAAMLAGLFLGWQAVVVLGPLSVALYAIARLARRAPRLPLTAAWTASVLAWLLAWQWLAEHVSWLG